MEASFHCATALALLIGAVHSLLGEILIFRKLRFRSILPAQAAPPLSERHIRILWATWHVVTIFGFAFAAILFRIGSTTDALSMRAIVLNATSAAFLGASILVLVGTRARHPGWVGLAGVATLVTLAASVN